MIKNVIKFCREKIQSGLRTIWNSRLAEKVKDYGRDYGKIGFWAVLSAVMPIAGFTVFTVVVYQLSPWLKANPEVGIPSFILTVSVLSGLAILPTNFVGVASGWAFGFPLGLLAMLSAIAGAVTLNYFIAKRLAGPNFQQTIKEKPKLEAIHNALLEGNAFKVIMIIVLLRISPATPFAATNFLLSASGVPIRAYVLGTVIAYIPRTSVTVFAGSGLRELDFNQPTEAWMIILGIAATVIVMIVIGALSKRALDRLTLSELNVSET